MKWKETILSKVNALFYKEYSELKNVFKIPVPLSAPNKMGANLNLA